ncbi:ImuA family protein [Acidisoma sp. C75]
MSEILQNLTRLRGTIAGLERGSSQKAPGAVLPFGLGIVDRHLPGGGLRLGGLHELADQGAGQPYGSAAALMVAGILARLPGPVLWISEREDLFPPGLAAAGLHPDRVLHVRAPRAVPLVMEEGLRHGGAAGIVGEVGTWLRPTAARRLQLAAETAGFPAFTLCRPPGPAARPDAARPHAAPPIPALTRWRITRLPSGPPVAAVPEIAGLAPALWQVDLIRCRGAEAASWIVEACDETGHLRLPAALADRAVAPAAGGGRRLLA